MPLQNFMPFSAPAISAAWLNTVDVSIIQAIGDGSAAPTTQTQVRNNIQAVWTQDLLSSASNGVGVGMVGWSAFNTYPAPNTLGNKLLQYVDVRDEGAVGDGVTDDSAAIQAAIAKALARGVKCVFDGTKTYLMSVASWAIAAGTQLETNGCTILCGATTTGNTVWLTIADNVTADRLYVHVPTGIRRDRCISISGGNWKIGILSLTSTDQQANSEGADAGVQFGGIGGYIGQLIVQNYDRPVIAATSVSCTVLRTQLQSYVRGIYGYDNVDLHFDGGRIWDASPNATGSAGHNAVLLGCTSTGAQHDVYFRDFSFEDATEHGVRIGGPEEQYGLHFTDCIVRRAGGCGYKVLGTNAGIPTARNHDIVFNGCSVVDVGRDGSLAAPNRSAFLIKFCDHVQIIAPICYADTEALSCAYGVFADGASDVRVTTPDIISAEFDGIAFVGTDGDVTACTVTGGMVRQNGRYGYNLQSNPGVTVRQCVVNGLAMHGNADLGFRIDNNGGGFLSNYLDGKTYANTNGLGSCNNNLNMELRISCDLNEPAGTPLSGISARNGSTISDGVTLNLRKGGAWTAL